MNYGKALRMARAMSGIQQKRLANRAGLHPSHISLIESGRRIPSVRSIEKLSRALGIPSHLFTLLASDPGDLRISDPQDLSLAVQSLAHLILEHAPKAPSRRSRSRSAG